MASRAPASLKLWAIAQAMLRLLRNPNTTAFFPFMLSIALSPRINETEKDNRMGREQGRWSPGGGLQHAAPSVAAFLPNVPKLSLKSPFRAGIFSDTNVYWTFLSRKPTMLGETK